VPDTSTYVTITVNPVNDAPKAVKDSFQALADRTLNVAARGVLGNDSDIDGDALTAEKVANPTHGMVVLASDGSFSYTPTAGYRGPDAFSYRAYDGSLTSATRIVTLTVTAVPTAPPPTVAPPPTTAPTVEPTPTATPEASPSTDPTASPSDAATPSPSASLEPGATSEPEPSAGAGGLSLPVLVVGLLLLSLLAFGAAIYLPKLLDRQRAGGPMDDVDLEDDNPEDQ
jgi:hypothetical protein